MGLTTQRQPGATRLPVYCLREILAASPLVREVTAETPHPMPPRADAVLIVTFSDAAGSRLRVAVTELIPEKEKAKEEVRTG